MRVFLWSVVALVGLVLPALVSAQLNYIPIESDLISEGKWAEKWKRKDPIVVYMVVEYCEEVVSAFNSTCVSNTTRKAVFFPKVDKLALLEVPNSTHSYIIANYGIPLMLELGYLAIWLNTTNANILPTTKVWIEVSAYNETTGEQYYLKSTKKHWADPTGSYIVGSYTVRQDWTRPATLSARN